MTSLLDLSADLPLHELPAGTQLVAEGGPDGAIYVLVSGRLGVQRGGVTVATIDRPGALIGEMSVLLGVRPTATVTALSDVAVRVATDATTFLASRPEMGLLVARLLAERLHLVTTYLADLKQQYGGTGTQLGLVDEVLSSITTLDTGASEPGSEREPDPLY